MKNNINRKFDRFLTLSYLRYVLAESVDTSEFRLLCDYLRQHYEEITHPEKNQVLPTDLENYTGEFIVYYPESAVWDAVA